MTQIKLRRDTSAAFASSNPILGNGEPAYETDTKKLKIGDGTTAYNSLAYFTMVDEFATYREKYGAPSDSIPVVNTGNSVTIKSGVSIETPNGTLTNPTDITYTYDFLTDRVLFATENDYYHAYAVYYGGREPSPVGEQIFWFNNNVWTAIAGDGTKTVFNTQKITPIAKIYQVNGTVKNIDYSSYTKISSGGTSFDVVQPLKLVDGTLTLQIDNQTIQIVDGKLTANSTAPTNMVTTDTAQTITGQKEFNHTILSLNQDLIRGQQSTSYRNGAGLSMGSNSTSTDGGVFAPQWRIYNTQGDVDRTETIMTTYNQSKLNASNFNTANKLVRLDSSGKLPAIDGSNLTNLPGGGSAPSNMVTTDTAQTISGDKTLTGITTVSNDIKLTIGKKITTPDGQWLMQLGTGFIGIGTSIRPLTTYDSSNYYLHNKSVIAGDGIKITEPSIGEIQISSTIGNMAAYVTEEFIDGTEGYRVWSNGRCEQWGSFTGKKSITFLKNYVDANYTLLAYVALKTSNEAYNGVFGTAKTTTGFTVGGLAGTTGDAYIISTCGTIDWYTSGILAS